MMVSFAVLALFATPLVAALIPRDGATVLAALRRVDNDTVFLGQANQAYNGSVTSAAPIVLGVTALHTDLEAAAEAARLSAVFSAPEAESIIAYVKHPLEPDTAFTIGTLRANREKIRQAGLYATVQMQLAGLRTAVERLVNNTEAKTPKSQYAAAKRAPDKYEGDYEDAVAYFS